jgi:hypothetical protein
VQLASKLSPPRSRPPSRRGKRDRARDCGGFLAGSAAILATGLLLDGRTAVAFQHALLPMLAFSIVSLVRLTRLRRAALRAARAA